MELFWIKYEWLGWIVRLSGFPGSRIKPGLFRKEIKMKKIKKFIWDYFSIILGLIALIGVLIFMSSESHAADGRNGEALNNSIISMNVVDQIEYAKHVGKVPEREDDLDFWMKVTEPPTEEDLVEEDKLGDMELLSQLVQCEAGNQDLTGMRLVADVVLNRVDSPKFPNTIREVIYQPGQFEVVRNGMLDDAAWEISDNAFKAVDMAFHQGRIDPGILYFSTHPVNGHGFWKHGAHWFSY